MVPLIDPAAIRSLPRPFAAKSGAMLQVRLVGEDLPRALLEMYLAFQPRNSFQGLPPIKDAVCAKWVEQMLATGINVVAHADGPGVVGHTALFPINDRKCEMLVVVSPPFQNQGIGTELVRCVIDLGCELGFEKVWLPVDAINVRARHVYKKCGFEYVSNHSSRELDMALDLAQRRARANPGVGDSVVRGENVPAMHVAHPPQEVFHGGHPPLRPLPCDGSGVESTAR